MKSDIQSLNAIYSVHMTLLFSGVKSLTFYLFIIDTFLQVEIRE